ncbi:MAG: hypothetical protein ASARMPREDX12_005675 [Alectoria sarmentosa]|nr:MAG: hypothetical protein ASARMPREDX12_005675 [Alectoria sarmentosa]
MIQKVDGVFEVVMNFLTASLPFIFLLNLQTCLRKKWGVMTIAFLAYGTAGASICRVYCGIGDDDPSWDLACVEICLSVEQNIGTVITSMPTLGKYLWPNPPHPSCWGDSQSDDIHLQHIPNFPDWQFEPESDAASMDANFWHAVDSQMGGLSFDAEDSSQVDQPQGYTPKIDNADFHSSQIHHTDIHPSKSQHAQIQHT